MKTLQQLEAELEGLSVEWRWGESRRFQSNRRTIERREKLIRRIVDLKSKEAKKV